MSGTHINRARPNKCIYIILDKIFNKSVPKPTNLRPTLQDYKSTTFRITQSKKSLFLTRVSNCIVAQTLTPCSP
jgi:hypothetical protein